MRGPPPPGHAPDEGQEIEDSNEDDGDVSRNRGWMPTQGEDLRGSAVRVKTDWMCRPQ